MKFILAAIALSLIISITSISLAGNSFTQQYNPKSHSCKNGQCCEEGETNCSDQCVDLRCDIDNCGECSTKCKGKTAFCHEGKCACGEGYVVCDNTCKVEKILSKTSTSDCRKCGNKCKPKYECNSETGKCEKKVIPDPCHTRNCPEGTECQDGECKNLCDCDEEFYCPKTQMCHPFGDYCGEPRDPCYNVHCEGEQTCKKGKCQCDKGEHFCEESGKCIEWGHPCPTHTSCKGIRCGFGMECKWGNCVCPKGTTFCEVLKKCSAYCPAPPTCTPETCTGGRECNRKGVCECPDDESYFCSLSQQCVHNAEACRNKCSGIECPKGQHCFEGTCGKRCPSNTEYCRYSMTCIPAGSDCDLCTGKTCPAGEYCKHGKCISCGMNKKYCPDSGNCIPEEELCDKCAGKVCPANQECVEGVCTPCPAAKPYCPASGRCVLPRECTNGCSGVTCRINHHCVIVASGKGVCHNCGSRDYCPTTFKCETCPV